MNENAIRLAIFGIGNCASSLVQAIEGSRMHGDHRGLESPLIGRYTLADIQVVLAYDISKEKVGLDLSDAIKARPNCTTIYNPIGRQGIEVQPGILQDGLDGPLSNIVEPHERCSERKISQVEQELQAASIDVAVCYLPTGACKDVQAYAMAAARARVAFINACPEPVVHDQKIRMMFELAHVPLLGDDMKSHAGATALHSLLIEFLHSRNIIIDNTYQLNIGGNADFKNLAEQSRALSKHKSKRAALEGAGIESNVELLAGPTGFVPFLKDRKTAYIRLEASSVLDMKLNIEARLEVEDSPNVVSVIADAIRIAMLTKRTPETSQLACAHLFKNPLKAVSHSRAQADYTHLIQEINEMTIQGTDNMTVRESVRAVIIDDSYRILLSRVTPLGASTTEQQLWVTLGGRVQEGENLMQTLERELSEELGKINYVVGPKVWLGDEFVTWNGKQIRLVEHFFLVSVPAGDYRFIGGDNAEVSSTHELRWWTTNDITISTDRFVPCHLAKLLDSLSNEKIINCKRVQLEPDS